MSKRKRTKNNLQNITQKTKDHATRITLKTGVNSSIVGNKFQEKYLLFKIFWSNCRNYGSHIVIKR
jgi:hypothetical protein